MAVGVLGWWAAGADPLPGDVRARRRSTGRDRNVSSIIYIAEREWSSVAVMLGVAVLAAEVFDSAWPYQSITCVVLAVMALDRSWVRVSVDSWGLTLAFAFPGAVRRRWPLLAIARRTIVSAAVDPLAATEFPKGTWGLLRWEQFVAFRDRKAGATLRLQLTTGRVVLISMPDAVAKDVAAQLEQRRTELPGPPADQDSGPAAGGGRATAGSD